MELIRGANPYPGELPPLPIEPLLPRLSEDGSLQPLTRSRVPLFNIGGVMAAVSVVVALGVAVAAITVLGHRHSGTVTGRSSVSSSRQQLLQTLGVLRRPQIKSDLLATRPGGEGGELPGIFRVASAGLCRGRTSSLLPCTVRLDKPLVRAVDIGAGYRAAIFPTKIERSTGQAQRGEGVVMALRGPGLYIITSNTPTSTQALRNHGLLLSDYVASGIDRGAMLVPDGVVQVRLDRFRLLGPRKASLGQVPPTTSTVTNNVALLQITGLTEQNLHLNPDALGRYFNQGSGHLCQTTFAVYALPATAQMTWLNSAGNTIKRTTLNLELYVGSHHPAPGTTSESPNCTASKPRVSLAEIAHDVMCVSCHQRLDVAQTAPAVAEREYISSLIAKGDTKRQIENNLVAQYGPKVLSVPKSRGSTAR